MNGSAVHVFWGVEKNYVLLIHAAYLPLNVCPSYNMDCTISILAKKSSIHPVLELFTISYSH